MATAPGPPAPNGQTGASTGPAPVARAVSAGSVSGIQGVQAHTGDDRTLATASVLALAIVTLAGVTASFFVAQNEGQATRASEQVAQLQSQLKSGEVGAALTKVQTVSRQLGTFQTFLKDAPPWPDLLTVFSTTVPGSLKLTSAAFSGEKTLRIDGEARDYATVAQFVAALRKSTSFPNPQLGSVSLNESVDGTTLTFSVSTGYVPKQPASSAGDQPSNTTEATDAE